MQGTVIICFRRITIRSMSLEERKFNYVYSCDLDCNVEIKIGGLEGRLPKPDYKDLVGDVTLQRCACMNQPESIGEDGASTDLPPVQIEVEVICDGDRMGLPSKTAHKRFIKRYTWNQWLQLPVRYSELSADATVLITLYDYHTTGTLHTIAGTSLRLFSKRSLFRQGIYDLKMHPFKKADAVETKGKIDISTASEGASMLQLSKLAKRHRNGYMPKVDWLDRLTFREIEVINERDKRSAKSLFLMIEFPFIHGDQNAEYRVVYFEQNGDEIYTFDAHPPFGFNFDPELDLENLVETKHLALARGARSRIADRDLKPNAETRDRLARILHYPPTVQLSSEERDLVWKYRYCLKTNKKALAKFLKAVDWKNKDDVAEALRLLQDWEVMDVGDALELLSPAFTHPAVRRYAVQRLGSAEKADLQLYLLQLVQALRYEPLDETSLLLDASATSVETAAETTSTTTDSNGNDLADFLIETACSDWDIANYLYWYLKVESTPPNLADAMDMAIGTEDRGSAVALSVFRRLSIALAKVGPHGRNMRAMLLRQQSFVDSLASIIKATTRQSSKEKKVAFLQAQLLLTPEECGDTHSSTSEKKHPRTRTAAASEGAVNFAQLDSLPLPVDPNVRVHTVLADRVTIFNSSQNPAKLTFRTSDGELYTTIFKHGDDLRQDQLVLQIISLMDRVLKQENLDLRLTTYRVLATSSAHGFVQFVESIPFRTVITTGTGTNCWGSVQNFLKNFRPDPNGPCGIEQTVMDNYVRSCAGYSVITYLLGIGDRHLDNLLLCRNGKIFHIDFGFILGRDPKPMPPPMKITKEMIDGMGGQNSAQWQTFCSTCYTTFLILRRHANLILNLFALMVDASIPDIALEPDKAVQKVLSRFRLDLSDEEAVQFIQEVIDASVSAKMALLSDWVHGRMQ